MISFPISNFFSQRKHRSNLYTLKKKKSSSSWKVLVQLEQMDVISSIVRGEELLKKKEVVLKIKL